MFATYGTDADTMNSGVQNKHQKPIPFDPDTFPNPPGVTTQEYPRLEDLIPKFDGNSSTSPSVIYVFAPPGVKYNDEISNETFTILTKPTPTDSKKVHGVEVSSSEGREEK